MLLTWKLWNPEDTSEPLFETTSESEARREWLRLRNAGVLVELESPDGETTV